MNEIFSLMMNNSILHRSASRFVAKELADYDLAGVTSLLILILIYENPGIGMAEVAQAGSFDKGTITKAVAKLQEQGYVTVRDNPDNRRAKKLYATEKLKASIGEIYAKRQAWKEVLTRGMSSSQIEEYQSLLAKIAENARTYAQQDETNVRIFGFQKVTLLDFPGLIGSTVFLGGCNLRCPYCHNSSLVYLDENAVQIPTQDVLDYLQKRVGLLDGVCVSGGEPTLQEGLGDFLGQIKAMGYKTKLDTNGVRPERLKELVEKGLVDYVAMDIKNAADKYGITIGISGFDVAPVKESVSYLLNQEICDYEFRTTLVREYHNADDIRSIGEWIQGAKHYYLQSFRDADGVLKKGLHAPDEQQMQEYLEIARQYVHDAQIR